MMFARRIFIDIYISMFMALTLVCFALAERYPARRRLWMALMYVAVGLGVLTKGPVAALVPGLVFAIYLTVHRELQRARDMMIPLGVLIVLAIVVPWYAALYTREGWGPIFMFFLGENVARYTDGFGVQVDRGFFFYLPVLFTDSFPWSLLLFPAAAAWIADRRRSLAGRDAGFRVRTLLWLWIIVIVAFFSLSAAKQDLYIFPIVPAVSALGGLAIARAFRSPDLAIARHVRLAVIATGACAFVIGAALIYLFTWVNQAHQLQGTALTGIAAVAGGITAVGLALRGRLPGALFTIAAATAALNWVLVLRVLPSFEAYKPVPAFASVLRARLDNDDVVATYDEALPSLVFYLERHVEEVFDRDPLLRLFESDTTAYVVMRENEYERIRADIGVPTCVVQSQPTFDVKLRNVLARDPLPDLVLVTNRCRSGS
jgi:4-amino-4-deoxy-L-arabinose transferase-like glycosyltransferase